MAIDITVEEVREICPVLEASDAAIQLAINVVGCKIDVCLESNYSDCEPLQRAIKIYTVAYFADKGNDNNGTVTGQKWADGDSQTYSDVNSGSSPYWDTALQLDSAGCVQNAFKSGKVFAVTGSSVKYNELAQ